MNDVVVHGFPGPYELRDGDIVSVDVGVYKNGFHGDHAYTFMIGKPTDEVLQLVRVTKESLYKGIEKAVAGNRVGDISYAIQEHTEKKYGYGVVRELVGHGLGKSMHEDPQALSLNIAGPLKPQCVISKGPSSTSLLPSIFTRTFATLTPIKALMG